MSSYTRVNYFSSNFQNPEKQKVDTITRDAPLRIQKNTIGICWLQRDTAFSAAKLELAHAGTEDILCKRLSLIGAGKLHL